MMINSAFAVSSSSTPGSLGSKLTIRFASGEMLRRFDPWVRIVFINQPTAAPAPNAIASASTINFLTSVWLGLPSEAQPVTLRPARRRPG
jgi:hypothetical protein